MADPENGGFDDPVAEAVWPITGAEMAMQSRIFSASTRVASPAMSPPTRYPGIARSFENEWRLTTTSRQSASAKSGWAGSVEGRNER